MTLLELCKKEVVQLGSGVLLGQADDLIFDEQNAHIKGILLRGRPKLFGLLGRDEDIVIAWEEIHTIGQDVILVNAALPTMPTKTQSKLQMIFHNFVKS